MNYFKRKGLSKILTELGCFTKVIKHQPHVYFWYDIKISKNATKS